MVLADQGETAEIFTLPRPEYSQTTNPLDSLGIFPIFSMCQLFSAKSLGFSPASEAIPRA
jgi:hypothetical protein